MEEKYLYFRTVADTDNDDGIDDSIYIPASSITGILTNAVDEIVIHFQSVKNNPGIGGGTTEEV